jgi:hypothetical protein
VALAIEIPAGVDQQAGSVDVAHDHAVLLDFETLLGVNRTLHLARDADDKRMDIPFHFALIVDHDSAVGDDFTFEKRIQPNEATRDFHLSFHFHAGLKPANPVVGQIGKFAPAIRGFVHAEGHFNLHVRRFVGERPPFILTF